jgi:hypothetical protein
LFRRHVIHAAALASEKGKKNSCRGNNQQLGNLLAEVRELGKSTSQKFSELGQKVSSFEAATSQSQTSIQAQLETVEQGQAQLGRDLRGELRSVDKRITTVEERTNATVGALNANVDALVDRISKLEAALAEQRNMILSTAASQSSTLSADWATTGVNAVIDYSNTGPVNYNFFRSGSLTRGVCQGLSLVSHLTGQLPSCVGVSTPAWPAEVVLEKEKLLTPGRCLSIGPNGNVTVLLPLHVRVDAVGVETIRSGSNGDVYPSSPKDVSAWAGDERMVAWDAVTATTAEVNPPKVTNKVTFQVRSNNGEQRFTCIYRVNVHGVPVDKAREL